MRAGTRSRKAAASPVAEPKMTSTNEKLQVGPVGRSWPLTA